MRRTLSRTLAAVASAALTVLGAGCSDQTQPLPAAAESTAERPEQQDAGHQRLNVLVGEWTGAKSTFVAGGTVDNPVHREIVSRWHWIGKTGNNFLQEEAEGTPGGAPYYRLGLLGYAPTDNRYEWTTVDNVTPMTMSYKGAQNSGGGGDISMAGEFTDPGILGPQFTGKTIPMRTLIKPESQDRVVMEIYFSPPGAPEQLADRVELTRRR
ncbi:DUF1579 family protein [Nocardia sp. NPDC051787]|uniref:DUF1579 family protein n=1 Tax=Nocardia sp. NPDC051787 TaxID=3155415 RepID=UPI00344ACBD3